MEIQNQVVSLELAKQLKALGVPQDSLFYWVKWDTDEFDYKVCYYDSGEAEIDKSRDVSAFSVAELGEMLPWRVEKDECFYILTLNNVPNAKECWYENRNPDTGEVEVLEGTLLATEHTKTEADARAKMLIWLIENKYLDLSNSKVEE